MATEKLSTQLCYVHSVKKQTINLNTSLKKYQMILVTFNLSLSQQEMLLW